MALYYVYMQWPSDTHPSVPYQSVHLVAGPFDQGRALRVRQEMEDHHKRSGTEADRDLNEYLYGRKNDYTPTDQGKFYIKSVDQLRAERASGKLQIYYRTYLHQYEAEMLS